LEWFWVAFCGLARAELPHMSSFNVLSRRFARQDLLLVLDGAPNHRSGDLAVPDNVPLLILPAGTQSEGKSLG